MLGLGTAPGSLPWSGELFRLEAFNLPIFVPAVACFGASITAIGSQPLPYGLAALGAPGCALHHSHEVVLPITPFVLGTFVNVPILSDWMLIGMPFYAQVWSLDPNANPLGVATSNALEATAGVR